MALQPCAHLHNHPRDGEIDHPNQAGAALSLSRAPSSRRSYVSTYATAIAVARCMRSRTAQSSCIECSAAPTFERDKPDGAKLKKPSIR